MFAKPSRRARLAAAALACGLAVGVPASGQTMYKWIDEQGKVQYSDKPPKGFKGEVTLIEADAAPTLVPPVKKPQAAPAKEAQPVGQPVAEDMNSRRKANRERLEVRLDRARLNLEHAKKALAEAPGPDIDERQVIQQRVKGGAASMSAMAARSNCRQVIEANGRKSTVCPAVLPGTAYYERIATLEEAVRRAEGELEEAEIAYRRGRD